MGAGRILPSAFRNGTLLVCEMERTSMRPGAIGAILHIVGPVLEPTLLYWVLFWNLVAIVLLSASGKVTIPRKVTVFE